MATPGEPVVATDARASRGVGDVFVQLRQGHVAQQRRKNRPLRGTGVVPAQDAILTEDARWNLRGRNLAIHSAGDTERIRFATAADVLNALTDRFVLPDDLEAVLS